MSTMTTPVDRYTSIEPLPMATGGDAQRQLAQMKGRLITRYGLAAVPGKPEELVRPDTNLAVSVGYGCKTIRVRAMIGRRWVDELTHDFQIGEGWGNALCALLDQHFGPPKPTPSSLVFTAKTEIFSNEISNRFTPR